MAADRWHAVSEIFHQALARDGEARAAYLAEACKGDPDLRDEVETFLAAYKGGRSLGTVADILFANSPLPAGATLGPYRIQARIGAGGMGVVYRATDPQLGRDVALKMLPPGVAADADRVARFLREARLLASLNHPNIAQVYGFDDPHHPSAIVMELVDGDTLADVIARGPVPVTQAVGYARQIADALDAAHEQGIIHRDLKPANIKVKPDGKVKVLDFGLAKPMDPVAGGLAPAVANSPTLTAHRTDLGVIVGTAAYMSPEQARGKPVDRRADVWAFGAVFYEMLTGRRAFDGPAISDVLASVLKTEPDWSCLPRDVPPSVRRLLRWCMEKDPRRRLGAIADARLELEEIDAFHELPLERKPSWWTRGLAWTMVGAAAAVAVMMVVALYRGAVRPDPLLRVSMLPAPGAAIYPDSTAVAMSPDGTMVAFTVGDSVRSSSQLWVRSLDSLSPRLLVESGASLPFWSPDGRHIAFFADSKLQIVSAAGGRPQFVVALSGTPRGGAWGRDGTIVYAPDSSGVLYRVAAAGGTPAPVTTLDASRKQVGHRFPAFLPDGDHFLYAAIPRHNGGFEVFASSLSSGGATLVGTMESAPVYAEPGYLLYSREGGLVAQAFDARRLKLTGEPIALDDDPSMILDPWWSMTAGRPVSVSSADSFAYYSAASQNTVAEWYDTLGHKTGTVPLPPGHYEYVRISPDGTQAAVVKSVSRMESSIWLIDLARGGASPLSSGPHRNDSPVWSPDGTRVVFYATRNGPGDLYMKTVGDSAPEKPFLQSSDLFKNPNAWSADGRWIAMTQLDPVTKQNVWLLPASNPRDPKLLVSSPAWDQAASFSPDSALLAYASAVTGTFQLYVRPLSGAAIPVQVSETEASALAWWSRDGRQLIYPSADLRTLWRVEVSAASGRFSAGKPLLMATLPPGIMAMDATPDRQRFLALSPERTGTGSITVVRNWRAALNQKR